MSLSERVLWENNSIGRKLSDWIAGEIIDSQARRYIRSRTLLINPQIRNVKQYFYTLEVNAYCYLIKRFRFNGIRTSEIDALEGEKIKVYADKHVKKGITKGTSRHRIQLYRHSGNAYAFIAVQFRYLHS